MGKSCSAAPLILATGGASYPLTGSTGDGYTLAKQAGHSLVALRPALVPIVTAGSEAGSMAGLQLRNIAVRLFINGKKKGEAFGELAFTRLWPQRPGHPHPERPHCSMALQEKRARCTFLLDLKPALDEKKLDARLVRDFEERRAEPMHSVLRGLLPKEMVAMALASAHIDKESPGRNRPQRRTQNDCVSG